MKYFQFEARSISMHDLIHQLPIFIFFVIFFSFEEKIHKVHVTKLKTVFLKFKSQNLQKGRSRTARAEGLSKIVGLDLAEAAEILHERRARLWPDDRFGARLFVGIPRGPNPPGAHPAYGQMFSVS